MELGSSSFAARLMFARSSSVPPGPEPWPTMSTGLPAASLNCWFDCTPPPRIIWSRSEVPAAAVSAVGMSASVVPLQPGGAKTQNVAASEAAGTARQITPATKRGASARRRVALSAECMAASSGQSSLSGGAASRRHDGRGIAPPAPMPARAGGDRRARGRGGPRIAAGRRGGRGSAPSWARP